MMLALQRPRNWPVKDINEASPAALSLQGTVHCYLHCKGKNYIAFVTSVANCYTTRAASKKQQEKKSNFKI